MRKVQGEGTYTRKSDGTEISYSFEYEVVESIKDIGEAEALALINRMLKVDANNVAREKAKVANGDSTARVLTPEQKEANKKARKELSDLVKLGKAKGMSVADIIALVRE
jgi:hypothetical protein